MAAPTSSVSCYQYVIVCSERAKTELPNALKALEDKYSSKWPGKVQTIFYPDSKALESCLPKLTQLRPSYTCFLAHYKECSKDFVTNVHRLCRRIDPTNPFTDTVWGILTGLVEEDLLFSVRQQPLTVRRVLGGTPVKLGNFESGSWYSEGQACVSYHKSRDEKSVRKVECPRDTTQVLINELSNDRDVPNEVGVDMMVTSGHATESDWQIGYSYENGQFVCMSSHMTGKAMDSSLYPVTHNGSPKVLSAAGNCLMGHIRSPNCMALAWMHSVGVVQMTGYVEPTWFGFMGWGVHKYFINLPGAYSFSESFFANNQALIAKLSSNYPKHSSKNYKECRSTSGIDKECLGLLFDKDVVAFYGDPAYEARLTTKPEVFPYKVNVKPIQLSTVEMTKEWSYYELVVMVTTVPDRPVVHMFPCTVKEYRIIEGGDEGVVITCRFVLVPIPKGSEGKTLRVVYGVLE